MLITWSKSDSTISIADSLSIVSSVPVKPVFTVPFQRDHEFIDRKSIFSQIEEKLQTHHQVSLFGIGGVGYDRFFQPLMAIAEEYL